MALTENTVRTNYGSDIPSATWAAAKGVVFFQGAIVCVKADGFAYPAITATGLKIIGYAEYYLDTSDDAADGDHDVVIKPGTHGDFLSSGGGDTIAEDDRGKTFYVTDDATVALTDGGSTKSAGGTIYDVNDDGTVVCQFEVIR